MSNISRIPNASALFPMRVSAYVPALSDDALSPPEKYFDTDFTNSTFPLIWGKENGGVNGTTIPQLTELMRTYLFDIARIIVDNDRNSPGRIVWNANQVATVMNWLMNIITTNAGNLPTVPLNNWLGLIPMNESRNSVRLYLIKKITGYTTALMKHKWGGRL